MRRKKSGAGYADCSDENDRCSNVTRAILISNKIHK